jgi:hypothetical protein
MESSTIRLCGLDAPPVAMLRIATHRKRVRAAENAGDNDSTPGEREVGALITTSILAS